MNHLGVMISTDESMEKEVEARNTVTVLAGMNEVVQGRKDLSSSTKLEVMNTTVIPILMYGCVAWSLPEQQQL